MDTANPRALAAVPQFGTAAPHARAEDEPALAPGERHRQLLAAVATDRDQFAFIALFNHFAPRIKAYMKKLGASEEDADELAQDALFTVWRRAETYDPARSAVSSWIFTIARNLRIDRARRDQRRVLDAGDPLLLPTAEPAADEQVEVRQQQSRVRFALLSLPAEQAAVVNLAFYEGLSHGDIAARLALPLGTVKSRLRLAFQRIRLVLEDERASAQAPADSPPQRVAA
jgi:RNA polymerase sigma-70 factor (ECF subfamily)